jgi:hypothetical protein
MLFVMMIVLLSMLAVSQLAGGSILRSKGEADAAQTFQIAQAGADFAYQLVIEKAEANRGTIEETIIDVKDLPIDLPDGIEGTVHIQPVDGGTAAWITADASAGRVGRSVRVLVNARDVGIWNNAIFAGTGASGQAINGNVDIRGSVHLLGDGEAFEDLNGNGVRDAAEPFTDLNGNGRWDPGEPFVDVNGDGVYTQEEPYNDSNGNGMYDPPLTVTELNSAFSGTAHIGNNYNGMPSLLTNQIPTIPMDNGLRSLSTEVRVKHGLIRLQGNATIGQSSPATGDKGSIFGSYVNDGYVGNPGAGGVTSDNGVGERYDLGDRVRFPLIDGIGAKPYRHPGNNVLYVNHKAFLDSNSMTVTLSSLKSTTATFAYADGNGNSISWVPPSGGQPGRLTVNGIVKIDGNLDLGQKNMDIRFDGKGTIYTTGSVDVHSNLLPAVGKLFPTQTALGFIALRDVNLATGAGDSQLSMMGAFYAQGIIRSRKQNQIAGTFVANYYDMGTNVPNIYQVPSLSKNLPPGMPGDESIVSLKRRSWRERVPD